MRHYFPLGSRWFASQNIHMRSQFAIILNNRASETSAKIQLGQRVFSLPRLELHTSLMIEGLGWLKRPHWNVCQPTQSLTVVQHRSIGKAQPASESAWR